MGSQIELDDFETLVPTLRGVLEGHEIDDAKYYSILSDILFHFGQ